MATDKDIVKHMKAMINILEKRAAIKAEINSLIIQRADIGKEVEKEKRNADNELAKYREIVKIEINGLTTQLNSLKGELKRLPEQIKSKQDSIVNYDKEITELKEEVKELKQEKKGLKDAVDGMREDAKKFSNKLAEV